MLQDIHRSLYIELLRKFLLSCALFAALFVVLTLIEHFVPNLKVPLLRWTDWDFIVGIPASVVGVAYVMTIANPNNYLGFYAGILMALLLSVQFYLIGSYDLVLLYLFVFIPFLIMSIKNWKHTQTTSQENPPAFLPAKRFAWVIFSFAVIIFLDYLLTTFVLTENNKGVLLADWQIKLVSAIMIGSSFFANLLLIKKKNEAWIFWVLYSISGIIFYILVNNIFSIFLFVIFMLVNANAQVAWFKNTKTKDMGWVSQLKI